jgi:hypothetical protein
MTKGEPRLAFCEGFPEFRNTPKWNLPLRGCHRHWLLQAEFQQGFAGHLNLLSLGQDLDARACGPSSRRANRRALSAARDGSNDRSRSGDATHFLGRSGALALAL